MMTRRDFEVVAEAVRELDVPLAVKQKVATGLASRLRLLNPNFDVARFIAACLRVR